MTTAEYASFVIVLGLAGWYALVGDLGIGFAAQNAITKANASSGNPDHIVLCSYLMLAATTLLVCSVVYLSSEPVAPLLFGNIPNSITESFDKILAWSGFVLTLGATTAISGKILYAVHLGYLSNLVTASCSVIGLLLLKALLPAAEHKVSVAVSALYGPAALFGVALAAWQVAKAWGSRHELRWAMAVDLVKHAKGFLLFGSLAAAVLQIDYLIMSQRVSPQEIVVYYTLAKVFAFVAFFNNAVMFAFWPRFTEAFTSGKIAEISGSLRKLILFGAAITLAATVLVVMFSTRLSEFLSPNADAPFRDGLIILFGSLYLARALVDPFAILLQSIGKLRPLIIFAAAQAVLSATLQWVLAGYWGIEGILAGLLASYLLTVSWGLPVSALSTLRASLVALSASSPSSKT